MKHKTPENPEGLMNHLHKGNSIDIGAMNNWRIFRIMAEFVEGWQFLSSYFKKITVFGSARTSPSAKWYKEATKFANLLAKDGFDVITGGGPGIMEAANRGASNARNENKWEKTYWRIDRA